MYKKQMLLGGLLRIKGMRQMIKSKPYQAERKKALTETSKAYKSKKAQKSTKDKKFLRGLQKMDTQRVKASRLLDMSQFLVKEARKTGRKDMTKVGRKLRRGVFDYGQSIKRKATEMINRKTQRKKLN
jgi:hypothetical protein|tara:strand:+ start:306 stop:689 length:384 start_codon:yes stop_codon:yes gene_type:complete